MSKVKALLFVASMVPFVLGAQNLIKNGDAESDLENWDPAKVQVVTENPHSGKSCFKTNTVSVIGTAVIPVDGTKTYKYSGWFRNADDKKPTLYFGLSPMTADKKEIKALQVCVMPGTETALAAPCKPEDTIIKIKDGSKWNIKDKYSHIGFNADNSGEYKDLPNTNVAAPVIVKVEKKDNLWEVTLEQACGMTYAADINVRIHRDGGYMYTGYIENFNSKDWKEITADIKGTNKSGGSMEQFWPGTKYVKIVILSLNGGMMCFDDLTLEEQK